VYECGDDRLVWPAFVGVGNVVSHGCRARSPSICPRIGSKTLSENYYDILGVPKDVSQKDLKKAFYKVSKQRRANLNWQPRAF
jgi:hypothetical protein